MKVTELLQQKPNALTMSVEITPPRRGKGIDSLFKAVAAIEDFKPLWIDVTSHSADVEWIRHPGVGTYRKRLHRKSPGTIAICGAIEHKFGFPTVPHLLCNGFTCEETEDALIDLHYLGVRNVLAIRGDGKPKEIPEDRSANRYATELISQIKNMNRGQYLDQQAEPTDFCVGVACYPEKHFEAPNLQFDIDHFVAKQQAGAEYAITQMCFDNEKFYEFMDKIKGQITIPVIPALKILTSKEQLVNVTKHFHVNIPHQFVRQIETAKSKAEVKQKGIEWACQQCLDFFDHGYTHVHFYIMKNTEPFVEVMQRLKATK